MRKRASTKGKIIIAALLICLSALYFYSWKDDVMRKFVYPLQYDYLVRQYAYEDKVDPALVASVILVESKFDERAASQPGAHGLMQVMPDTAQWIADEMGMTDYTPDKLNDVRTNIRLGTWYLAYLLKEYDGIKYWPWLRIMPAGDMSTRGSGDMAGKKIFKKLKNPLFRNVRIC